MLNILVTGVYGFLGSNLANRLVGKHNVFGLYNQNKHNNIDASIQTFSEADLVNFEPDVIIMCHAAVVSGNHVISNDKLQEINVDITKRLVDKFPLVKCVYISSVSVYGEHSGLINEYSQVSPISDYAKSKLMGEQIVLKKAQNIVIRLSSLYGAGMKENTLIPNYFNQALNNQVIEVWGTGLRCQNYIHVLDVVSLIEEIIKIEENIDIPILCVDNVEYSNRQVAELIATMTASEIKFVKEDQSASSFYNNTISKNATNWQAKISLEEGLKNYLEWKTK